MYVCTCERGERNEQLAQKKKSIKFSLRLWPHLKHCPKNAWIPWNRRFIAATWKKWALSRPYNRCTYAEHCTRCIKQPSLWPQKRYHKCTEMGTRELTWWTKINKLKMRINFSSCPCWSQCNVAVAVNNIWNSAVYWWNINGYCN